MKKTVLFLVLAVALLLTSCASLSMTAEDVGVFQKVATFEGQTEDELYTKARSWFVESFVSSESVIEQDDREAHVIKGKYVTTVDRNALCEVETESIITVEIKDGRARMTISTPISVYGIVGVQRSVTNMRPSEVAEINTKRQALFDSFVQYLSAEKEDW